MAIIMDKVSAHRFALAAAVFGSLLLSAGQAHAQAAIGETISVIPAVSGQLSGRTRAVAAADPVYQNEAIRAAAGGAAELKLRDQTRISVGSGAEVKLDRFVYDPDRASARQVLVSQARGAMRWVSGVSASQAYEVRTPHAIIGVRGTAFRVLVAAGRTTVTLESGAVTVCLRRQPRHCVPLDRPGAEVTVSATAVEDRAGVVLPTRGGGWFPPTPPVGGPFGNDRNPGIVPWSPSRNGGGDGRQTGGRDPAGGGPSGGSGPGGGAGQGGGGRGGRQ